MTSNVVPDLTVAVTVISSAASEGKVSIAIFASKTERLGKIIVTWKTFMA